MVQLLKTMLTKEEKTTLMETLSTLSLDYREVIQTLVDKEQLFPFSKLFFRKFQNTNQSTLFQVTSRPANLLIEIRFVYALLNTWCRSSSSKGLHTLSSMTRMHFPKPIKKRKWLEVTNRNKRCLIELSEENGAVGGDQQHPFYI